MVKKSAFFVKIHGHRGGMGPCPGPWAQGPMGPLARPQEQIHKFKSESGVAQTGYTIPVRDGWRGWGLRPGPRPGPMGLGPCMHGS